MLSFPFTALNSASSLQLPFHSLVLSSSQSKLAAVSTHHFLSLPVQRSRRNAGMGGGRRTPPAILCSSIPSSSSPAAGADAPSSPAMTVAPPVVRKRKRYRKPYPGEVKGITEEMRFVAMRLRNIKGKYTHKNKTASDSDSDGGESLSSEEGEGAGEGNEAESETWMPSMEGFVKYLVASKLVFNTVERILDKSDDVSYTHFRKTGLERSEALEKDLQWLAEHHGIEIPKPSNQGVVYAQYLEHIAEGSAPLFLSHLYNIYFSHIAGGQVIATQVCDKLLEGEVLEFLQWEGDAQELLKGLREKVNMLGEHWSRDEKNRCLKETSKCFKYMGQIVRLIIL
ncbi:unnamed protein product [Linum tenue]|uniref:Inactive heme oxygenase 2, chloroplastic n=1 Tax=Linum tenue TaxID=586396 RepID=A0AAV0RPL4_9ROSI|nr:unnamed protein product [Linum tenue]